MSKEPRGGFQPVSHHADYSGTAYMAPIILNEGAWEKIKKTISNSKPGEFYTFDADGNANLEFVNESACIVDGSALTVGDTPEQLSTIRAADAIMIDGKTVTREDVRKLRSDISMSDGQLSVLRELYAELQSEYDALAATIEALRKIFPLKVLIGCDGHLNYPVSQYNDMVEAFNASPQQHLRDVRAEAVIGAANACNKYSGDFCAHSDLIKHAASVKAGEK